MILSWMIFNVPIICGICLIFTLFIIGYTLINEPGEKKTPEQKREEADTKWKQYELEKT